LLSLDGAKERLHLVKANLLEEGSFDSAVEGCHAVFHTASPFFDDAKDPQVCFDCSSIYSFVFLYGCVIICFYFYVFQTELLDPALKGTLNVLKSCVNSPTLKRVVVTSSIAAVSFNDRPKNPDVVVDETWYSDPEYCKRNGVCSVSSHKLSLYLNPYYYTILYHLVLHIFCYFLFMF